MVIEGAAAGAVAGVVGSSVKDSVTEGASISVSLLTEIRDAIVALSRFSDVQRQRTIYPRDMSPNAGVTTGAGVIFKTDSPMRGHHLGFSGGTAGDQMVMRMGTANVVRWVASGGYVDIDLPILITGGVDLVIMNLTALTDANWRATLWYELPRDDIASNRMA